jgi:putative membrane protein
MDSVFLLFFAIFGCLVGLGLGLLPGTHSLTPIAIMWSLAPALPLSTTPEQRAAASLGLVIGWTISATVPSTLLFAPGDSHPGWVLPGAKLLLRGRALDAILWQNLGMLGALAALLALAPLYDITLRPLRSIVQPHAPWMLLSVICFMLLGEWPRAEMRHASPWRRLGSAWGYIGVSQLTFALSGALGLVLSRHSPLPPEVAYQGLLPAFSGLFAVPGLIQMCVFGTRPPPQTSEACAPPTHLLVRGCGTGLAAGLFAGFLPVISGGIGSLLAGHATAQRDDRVFLIAHGASRMTYTLFSALLLFLPGVALTRGGLSGLIGARWMPSGWPLFWTMLGSAALCAAIAAVAQWTLARAWVRNAHRLPVGPFAIAGLVATLASCVALTGISGLVILGVATGIGMLPVIFGTRRLNCLAVVLIPALISMTGASA